MLIDAPPFAPLMVMADAPECGPSRVPGPATVRLDDSSMWNGGDDRVGGEPDGAPWPSLALAVLGQRVADRLPGARLDATADGSATLAVPLDVTERMDWLALRAVRRAEELLALWLEAAESQARYRRAFGGPDAPATIAREERATGRGGWHLPILPSRARTRLRALGDIIAHRVGAAVRAALADCPPTSTDETNP